MQIDVVQPRFLVGNPKTKDVHSLSSNELILSASVWGFLSASGIQVIMGRLFVVGSDVGVLRLDGQH